VTGVGQQAVVGAQEGKVDAPRVQPDAVQVGVLLAPIEGQPLLHLSPEPQDVPVKATHHHHRPVGEAVQGVEV